MRNLSAGSLGICACVLALFASMAMPAAADTIAYYVPLQPGNQNFMGSLGMDFDVNEAIWLTGVGVFDPNAVANQPLISPLSVAIYNRDTEQQVAGTLYTFSTGTTGPLVGANLIVEVTPYLFLEPGHYSVVAWGYNLFQLNGNSGCSDGSCGITPSPVVSIQDDGDGLITFVGTARFGLPGQYPDNTDGGPTNRYLAGTFTFEDISELPQQRLDTPTAPVPEPGTVLMIAPALIGLRRILRRS
jgi:hypothetical protein